MVLKHIVLTLIVGAAAVVMAWRFSLAASDSVRVFGLILVIAGFLLWTVARFQLGSSFAVTAQAKHLVTRGVYRKIRNPIYVFGSLFILGFILLMGRPLYLLIFIAIIPMQLWRAGKEAKVLEEKFGEEYRSYRAGTWF
jgi:protein-S-isoprenylcysteine O-methyltransferase Ste14